MKNGNERVSLESAASGYNEFPTEIESGNRKIW
jgi:hypothetical protein